MVNLRDYLENLLFLLIYWLESYVFVTFELELLEFVT